MKYVWIASSAGVALALAAYWFWPRAADDGIRIIKVSGDFTDAGKPAPHIAVTLEKFNKIEIDMTYDQVKDLIGEDGMATASDGVRGANGLKVFTTLIEWKNDDGSAMSGQFTKGRLVSKNQHGLK